MPPFPLGSDWVREIIPKQISKECTKGVPWREKLISTCIVISFPVGVVKWHGMLVYIFVVIDCVFVIRGES